MDVIKTTEDIVKFSAVAIDITLKILLIWLGFLIYAGTHLYMFFILTEIMVLALCAMLSPTNPFKIFSNFVVYNYYILKFLMDVMTFFVSIIANLLKAVVGAVISIV